MSDSPKQPPRRVGPPERWEIIERTGRTKPPHWRKKQKEGAQRAELIKAAIERQKSLYDERQGSWDMPPQVIREIKRKTEAGMAGGEDREALLRQFSSTRKYGNSDGELPRLISAESLRSTRTLSLEGLDIAMEIGQPGGITPATSIRQRESLGDREKHPQGRGSRDINTHKSTERPGM